MGDDFAFINRKGDTIISSEKIYYSFQDTIITFGIVLKKGTYNLVGINRKGETLFEICEYDNGPDEFHEGLLRIKQNGKIGYANEKGEIIDPIDFRTGKSFGWTDVADLNYDNLEMQEALGKAMFYWVK